MNNDFSYQTETLGFWTETSPKTALLNLLEVMVPTLWFMEDDGSLEKMLCTVPQPCLRRSWVENAKKCADPEFRRAGLKAGDQVLAHIQNLPPTVAAFREIGRLGAVDCGVAARFERNFWERLVNHCFLRDGYVRSPKNFLNETAEMLEAFITVPDGAEPWVCPHCEQLGQVFDQLVGSRKSALQ